MTEKEFDDCKNLIIGTDKALELLASSVLWLMVMMQQLFTIFARAFGIILSFLRWLDLSLCCEFIQIITNVIYI